MDHRDGHIGNESMQNRIRFQSSSKLSLAGVIHQPDAGKPKAYALFAHCFTCTKNIKAAIRIADSLCSEGIAVLRFDFTGLGESEGEFAEAGFSGNAEDLVAAARYLAEKHQAPALLVGHSLGGTACLAAAPMIDSVRAIVTIGTPADAQHVLGLIRNERKAIEQQGEAEVNLGGQTFTIRKDFVDDIRAQKVRDGIRGLRRALLIMHSPVDEIVPIGEAARLYTSALHPKSFISLDDADHLLSRGRDSRYAARVLAAWATRYIGDGPEPTHPAPFDSQPVTALGRAADMFRLSINANGHLLQADEPERQGGLDAGPTPYDYLSVALASCTVMTLNMYARHKNLPLESVLVSIGHGKIHAEDCADCETRSGQIDRFVKRISLQGDLTSEQRQRLLEIADRCPVHRTLSSEISIESDLSD